MGHRLLLAALSLALTAPAQSLPQLPQVNTSGFRPAIAAQIQRAEANADAHPSDAGVVGELCMTLHAYQQYEPAEQCYLRVAALVPRRFQWPYLLASVEFSEGKYDVAARRFESALGLRADYLPAQLKLAQAYANLADANRAADIYKSVLAKHPDCGEAWYGLGRAQAADGDHTGAVESYTRAIQIFPEYGAAHFALASELRRAGKTDAARQEIARYNANVTDEPPVEDDFYRQIHELNLSAVSHIDQGAALDRAGDHEGAIAEHLKALEIDPENVQAHINLITLYGNAGDFAKAEEHFEVAVRLNPHRPEPWYDYGVLMLREHKINEAKQAFEHALAINPYYAEAHNNLGAIYETQGKLDEASNQFRAAIEAQPDYPLARFHLGRIYVNQNRYEDAIVEFKRALVTDSPERPTILYALAATYARAGHRDEALSYFDKARDAAAKSGQNRLLMSIERDEKNLQGVKD
jgi:tetratricopeptide (TPR) repeat protein